ELRLKDGAHHCEGRVEAKYQGEWGSAYTEYWHLLSADLLCRHLECGPAVDAPRGSYFGPRLGPIWYFYYFCNITEAELSLAINKCVQSDFKNYNDTFSHDEDVGAVCSGFVHLARGDGPCSGQVEVRSGEDWIPVSDGNFTLSNAQVICAELGCGKAVSVLGHMPFTESDGRVWAEEFRCEGEEPELWSCPRVPCPGGTCHHSGAAQVVCSAYTEVRLVTNSSSQCEGQVEINISGRWRALCASHWSLANANVVCRHLGCGVAISTPEGAEGNDQLWKARFHCWGDESFLWECAVTALGDPDCSHGNTASVICSGNQTQVLPQCDSVSEPADSAASEESAPYCSGEDSRQLRLVDGGGPCAGRVEILDQGSWGTICDDGWDLDDARVVCRQLGCGDALNATGSAHFGEGSGPIWLDDLNCTGKESHSLTQATFPALSAFEDVVGEGLYQEIDDLIEPGRNDLLNSQGNLSDDSATKLPYYTGDGGEDGGSDSAPGSSFCLFSEPLGQNINTAENGYDDVDELPVPINPFFPGMNEDNFSPEDRGGARYSQTGISLKSPRETVDSGVEEKESSLVLRQEEPGYDDVELSTM
ncbi:hypothetical protein FD754_012323, partial [Muntiacus muntjak]